MAQHAVQLSAKLAFSAFWVFSICRLITISICRLALPPGAQKVGEPLVFARALTVTLLLSESKSHFGAGHLALLRWCPCCVCLCLAVWFSLLFIDAQSWHTLLVHCTLVFLHVCIWCCRRLLPACICFLASDVGSNSLRAQPMFVTCLRSRFSDWSANHNLQTDTCVHVIDDIIVFVLGSVFCVFVNSQSQYTLLYLYMFVSGVVDG